MARNKLAGKAPSYDKRNMSKESREKKKAYDKKFSARPEQKKKRVETNKANREAGTYGKMTKMGKDRSHTKSGKLVLENRSTNRARNGTGKGGTRKSTKK